MNKFILPLRGLTAGTAIGGLIVLGLSVSSAFGADTSQRVQEATIGQQDRSLSVDRSSFEGYENSDYLRDMDAIARGTYIAPLESDSTESEDE